MAGDTPEIDGWSHGSVSEIWHAMPKGGDGLVALRGRALKNPVRPLDESWLPKVVRTPAERFCADCCDRLRMWMDSLPQRNSIRI